jgi:hypothetical protein
VVDDASADATAEIGAHDGTRIISIKGASKLAILFADLVKTADGTMKTKSTSQITRELTRKSPYAVKVKDVVR